MTDTVIDRIRSAIDIAHRNHEKPVGVALPPEMLERFKIECQKHVLHWGPAPDVKGIRFLGLVVSATLPQQQLPALRLASGKVQLF